MTVGLLGAGDGVVGGEGGPPEDSVSSLGCPPQAEIVTTTVIVATNRFAFRHITLILLPENVLQN